ncbi:hypothetical protein MLGJGCBP_07715 [Rhodococcus sp. T7]|nr:hypothetical protein MLGJGCBP_09135 [Rhodococcus sp. T7]KAF0959202.1 hypothetical protein MLGJGCBP_07715 [Rhodococcus sp. T7]
MVDEFEFLGAEAPTEVTYALGRLPDRIYVSRSFPSTFAHRKMSGIQLATSPRSSTNWRQSNLVRSQASTMRSS